MLCGRVTFLPHPAVFAPQVFRAFGLVIRSSLPLPELPSDRASKIDVEIRVGALPEHGVSLGSPGGWLQVAGESVLVAIPEVARYLVSQGNEVIIEPATTATEDDVRAFLLTVVLGILLHQRGELVLHGSAIAINGQAVGFLGVSGSGKSTLAAGFRRRGFAVLTDDLCVVRPTIDGQMAIYPSFPHMKLWLDSLQKLELSAAGLRRIHSRKLEKRALPLGGEFVSEPLPIRKLYILRRNDGKEILLKALEGPSKFAALKNQTYRIGLLRYLNRREGHFARALELARAVPMAIVARPSHMFCLDELVSAIEMDIRS